MNCEDPETWNYKGCSGGTTWAPGVCHDDGTLVFGANRTAVQVAVGALHSCAVLSTGELACWGANARGQLGDGRGAVRPCQPSSRYPCPSPRKSLHPSYVPLIVDLAGRTATQVVVGGSDGGPNDRQGGNGYTCVLQDDRHVRCWGARAPSLGDGREGTGATDGSEDVLTPRDAALVDLGGVCEPHHYGETCLPCPGLDLAHGVTVPCSGTQEDPDLRGKCNDTALGHGACHCADGFLGATCETEDGGVPVLAAIAEVVDPTTGEVSLFARSDLFHKPQDILQQADRSFLVLDYGPDFEGGKIFRLSRDGASCSEGEPRPSMAGSARRRARPRRSWCSRWPPSRLAQT